ncbi:hypothetical protein CFC21_070341 [Triticum aestivum]|uniref:Uncharacterized protein n=2 Tax=Triticum aestivum TaxID=4565 RepID=A0A3B6LHC1_WHEAT|nr:hypothetical protein CFC21_070341 [Triticum aestivum]
MRGRGRPPEAPSGSPSDPAVLPSPLRIAPASAPSSAQPDPIQRDQIVAGCEADVRAEWGLRWAVRFRDGHGDWIAGRLHHSPASRWTTLLDLDNDVRTGDYVTIGDQVRVGSNLRIDVYDVVVEHRMQMVADVASPIELLDSSSESDGGELGRRGEPGGATSVIHAGPSPGSSGDRRRVGGRFWALADADDEDEDEEAEAAQPSPASPTPSDLLCEFLCAEYDEDEVASTVNNILPVDDPARVGLHARETKEMLRRVVHRRTAASVIRPWKGPLPKVVFRATALIRMWSLLTPTEARERLVTGSVRWEMVARDIFNRFGWRSYNMIGN